MAALRFVLAGGGTSGHINPALAIADQILRDHPDAEIKFCGTARGLESDIVPRAGYSFTAIRASGLPGKPSLAMIRALADFSAGRRQCKSLLRSFSPNAVVGTGGYVCSPVVSAATSLKIPVLLHEQNAFPGRSNRLMARRSQAVCVSFPGTETFFLTQTKVIMTGNPVRASFFSLTRQSSRNILRAKGDALSEETCLVLFIGGSLGARNLNQAILGFDPGKAFSAGLRPDFRAILAAGRQYADVLAAAKDKPWLDVREYIHDIDLYMAAADLVVCRAGAMTCAELAALGRPSILIPYPHAAGDHQTYNARALVNAGAAILCQDSRLSPEFLAESLPDLLTNRSRLDSMGAAAAKLARPNAARDICDKLYEVML